MGLVKMSTKFSSLVATINCFPQLPEHSEMTVATAPIDCLINFVPSNPAEL